MGTLLALTVVITAATSIMVPVLRWMAGDGIPLPFLSDVTVPGLRCRRNLLRRQVLQWC